MEIPVENICPNYVWRSQWGFRGRFFGV